MAVSHPCTYFSLEDTLLLHTNYGGQQVLIATHEAIKLTEFQSQFHTPVRNVEDNIVLLWMESCHCQPINLSVCKAPPIL